MGMRQGLAELVEQTTKSFRGFSSVGTITLNFKQAREFTEGWVQITQEIAARQIAWFLKNLDRHFFGNQYKRKKARTARIVTIEKGKVGERLHAHLAVSIPTGVSSIEFIAVAERIWAHANWG